LPGLLDSILTSRDDLVMGDGSRPEIIADLVEVGFNVRAAKKGAVSVREGIANLQNFEILVDPECPYAFDEFRGARWPTDRLTGKVIPTRTRSAAPITFWTPAGMEFRRSTPSSTMTMTIMTPAFTLAAVGIEQIHAALAQDQPDLDPRRPWWVRYNRDTRESDPNLRPPKGRPSPRRPASFYANSPRKTRRPYAG
jgi:hypothetical protein